MAGLFPGVVAGIDALIGAAWILIFLLNILELSGRRKYELSDSSPPSEDLVAVIIPARNEEKRIRSCLISVFEQSQRNLQVIVVDDRSTDKTSEVVSELIRLDPRLSLIRGAELPEGWTGKPWACHQGHEQASGEWRLFIDSDTVLEKGAVAAALNYCKKMDLGAISLVPRIELERFSAKVVAPVLSSMIRLIYPLRAINNPESKSGLVVGGFLLIRKCAYEKIGGHGAVRSELVEDKQIGSNLKDKGIPFRLVTGRRLVTVALFTGGQGIWDSVKRTVTNPLRYQRRMTTTFASSGFILLTFPSFALAAGLLAGSVSQIFLPSFILSVLVPSSLVLYDILGIKNSSWSYALLAIVGGILITLAILRQSLGRGSLDWRGRRY